jgi:hypothetical protein
MGAEGSFSGRKVTGRWSWPLASIYCLGQEWSYTSTPSYVVMAWYLIK